MTGLEPIEQAAEGVVDEEVREARAVVVHEAHALDREVDYLPPSAPLLHEVVDWHTLSAVSNEDGLHDALILTILRPLHEYALVADEAVDVVLVVVGDDVLEERHELLSLVVRDAPIGDAETALCHRLPVEDAVGDDAELGDPLLPFLRLLQLLITERLKCLVDG